MKLLPRRESVIAVLLTSATVVVIILWITSYWYSLSIGILRSRENRQQRQQMFWGVYVQRGQVGIGRSRSDARYIQSAPLRAVKLGWEVDHELIIRAHGPVGSGSPWMSWRGAKPTQTILERAGFQVVNSTSAPRPGMVTKDRALLVPWWAVFLVTLTTAIRWTFFRERRLYWPKVGRCAACGYDLRESRDRCPECGLKVGSPGAGARVDRVED